MVHHNEIFPRLSIAIELKIGRKLTEFASRSALRTTMFSIHLYKSCSMHYQLSQCWHKSNFDNPAGERTIKCYSYMEAEVFFLLTTNIMKEEDVFSVLSLAPGHLVSLLQLSVDANNPSKTITYHSFCIVELYPNILPPPHCRPGLQE